VEFFGLANGHQVLYFSWESKEK